MISLTAAAATLSRLLGWLAVTSFPGLGPSSGFLQSTAWRAALALVVVFVMLAMTGWTAIRGSKDDANPLATAKSAWKHATFLGRPLPDPNSGPAAIRAFFAPSAGPRASSSPTAFRWPSATWAVPPSNSVTAPTGWRSTTPAPSRNGG